MNEATSSIAHESREAIGLLSHLRWLPVAGFVVLFVFLEPRPATASFEPRLLMPILNLLFSTAIPLLVAYLAGRSYALGEPVAVLLLGCGMLTFGVGSALAAVMTFLRTGLDANVTLYNIGAWLSALCCLASGLLVAFPSRLGRSLSHDARGTLVAYSAVLVTMFLVAVADLDGVFPDFFSPERGPTLLRQLVLGSSVVMFAASALLFGLAATRSGSSFMSWYALGLLLVACGLYAVFTQALVGSAIGWLGRVAQYAGCVYLYVAVRSVPGSPHPWRIPLDQILRETRQRHLSLVEMSPDAILVHADRRYVFANPAALKLLRAPSANSILGKEILEIVHPEEREAVRRRLGSLRQGNAIPLRETRVLCCDGSAADVEVTGAIVDFEGRPAVQIVMRDVTERKRAEAALRAALAEAERGREALREADRRKTEFLATLSHELRNPLAPIRYALELLESEQTRAHAIDVIDRQLTHLVRLVDDLLDVTRMASNKIQLRKRRVDLANIVRSAVEAASPEIDGCGHHLVVSLPPAPVWLDADPDRMTQVVVNLLTNAARYTPSGGRISVSALVDDGRVCLSVTDSGVGLAAEDVERVFDMFTQVGEPGHGGLGIGLSLVKGIVELHGGSVEARSEGFDRGTTFCVRLARATAPIEPPAGVPEAQAPAAHVPLRILVVDDNVDAAEMMQTFLEFEGHDVRVAHDGRSALAVLGCFDAQVGLLDIGLPAMDGYELARAIRGTVKTAQMYLVAVTGWGQESDRQRAREAGFDSHLTKPASPDEITRLLLAAQQAADWR